MTISSEYNITGTKVTTVKQNEGFILYRPITVTNTDKSTFTHSRVGTKKQIISDRRAGKQQNYT
jgi:hypothetical protein